jgi:hypothetical protein
MEGSLLVVISSRPWSLNRPADNYVTSPCYQRAMIPTNQFLCKAIPMICTRIGSHLTTVRKPICTTSPPNDRWLNNTDPDLSYLMNNNESGLALSLNGWVMKVTWGRDLSLKGRAKSLSDCSLACTDKQFAFCEPFQKNLWESVNCTCSIKVSV